MELVKLTLEMAGLMALVCNPTSTDKNKCTVLIIDARIIKPADIGMDDNDPYIHHYGHTAFIDIPLGIIHHNSGDKIKYVKRISPPPDSTIPNNIIHSPITPNPPNSNPTHASFIINGEDINVDPVVADPSGTYPTPTITSMIKMNDIYPDPDPNKKGKNVSADLLNISKASPLIVGRLKLEKGQLSLAGLSPSRYMFENSTPQSCAIALKYDYFVTPGQPITLTLTRFGTTVKRQLKLILAQNSTIKISNIPPETLLVNRENEVQEDFDFSLVYNVANPRLLDKERKKPLVMPGGFGAPNPFICVPVRFNDSDRA